MSEMVSTLSGPNHGLEIHSTVHFSAECWLGRRFSLTSSNVCRWLFIQEEAKVIHGQKQKPLRGENEDRTFQLMTQIFRQNNVQDGLNTL